MITVIYYIINFASSKYFEKNPAKKRFMLYFINVIVYNVGDAFAKLIEIYIEVTKWRRKDAIS